MSSEPQLFRIDRDNGKSEAMTEVEFAELGFQERRDIQEWVADNPGILGEDLLIIGKEFSGFDRTNERLDLLAVDGDGKLVVIELKRDDSGADAHWQAIKYASYLSRVDAERIIGMLADHESMSETDARIRLVRHVNSDDLNALNNDQRIILASHRFAPEVTSAAVWLNEKFPGENLMTCVQLVPYSDPETDSLYVQANTIIPVPGIEDYVVGVGGSVTGEISDAGGTSTLSETFARNRNDDVTRFLRMAADLAVKDLPDQFKPDKKSRWAGDGGGHRYYHLWYSSSLWANWGMTYLVNLYPGSDESPDTREAHVGFAYWEPGIVDLESRLERLHVYDGQRVENREILVTRRGALNDSFANELATTLRHFIEVITPVVHGFENERNEEDA